ncbi:Glycosyltransferase involved in cell wall bisynthesis [Halogranum rubrum]|uniref:Glycosyltransferase involved in cell wall bisynthesis n=1 Tax=Halogranum rubrum TaxID=553466 RepID=A0A1I4BB60_9EURY|nr:glycosyltransferase family 4 protein [Halogranum rubrum]SFK65231.1 Glycosyltransferase involved in cell wall bisynthesis [Halogranum rubrum]
MDSENLTVLLCTDYLPPGGGTETVVTELASHLASRGVDVVVFALTNDQAVSPFTHENITLHRISATDLTDTIGLQARISVTALGELRRVIKTHRPDVIHVHNRFFFTSYLTAVAATAGWAPKASRILTVHLGSLSELNGIGGVTARSLERTLGRSLCSWADTLIGVSESATAHARRLGVSPAKITTVPNAVDTNTFRPPSNRTHSEHPRILFVGRLVENKGPDRLLEALPAVFESHSDTVASFVGTGPLRAELEQQSVRLGIADRVQFHGVVDSVARKMRHADIFCRPSLTEGLPLTLLEAMASGIPPVMTPVADVPTVIDHERTGLLVEPNASAISTALTTLLKNDDHTQQMGSQAREAITSNGYGWAQRASSVLDVYESTLEKNTHR